MVADFRDKTFTPTSLTGHDFGKESDGRIDDLRLTVSRALEHYETNRTRHELEMTNRSLVARLEEIQQMASLD
ncbi:MAG: hypothetical protein H7Z38_08190 [Rubrivivax sp.]|nr:hypothetical protein [Pyrinomonadaceae bacterium]